MTAPAPDLQETVELWVCALRLLPHDPRALAALMKSGMPMPTDVQYLLGELFSPGYPPLVDVKVVARRTKVLARAIDKLNASREYAHRTANRRQSSQDAVLDIAERLGMAERQIYNWLSEDVPKQFEARLIEFTAKISSGNCSDGAERITHNDESADDLVLGAMSMTG